MKKGVNVQRVIYKIVATVIALWVGGEIIETIDGNINLTRCVNESNCSAGTVPNNIFNSGFSFLGIDGSHVDGVSTTGILSVIGIIAAASIVLEFVDVSM